jgi:hypothetical protein
VRSCVRPVCAAQMAAGHNAFRGSSPNRKHAFEDALTQTGSPDPSSDLVCITSFALANSFGRSVRWPPSCRQHHLRLVVSFRRNHSMPPRCRRVGAVHSIKSGSRGMSALSPFLPKKQTLIAAAGRSVRCQCGNATIAEAARQPMRACRQGGKWAVYWTKRQFIAGLAVP